MLQGTTKTGFSYEIPMERIDDYELVELIGQVDTNPFAVLKVIEFTLGEEGKDELKAHIKAIHGRVPIQAMTNEIIDIFTSQSKTKK